MYVNFKSMKTFLFFFHSHFIFFLFPLCYFSLTWPKIWLFVPETEKKKHITQTQLNTQTQIVYGEKKWRRKKIYSLVWNYWIIVFVVVVVVVWILIISSLFQHYSTYKGFLFALKSKQKCEKKKNERKKL